MIFDIFELLNFIIVIFLGIFNLLFFVVFIVLIVILLLKINMEVGCCFNDNK